MKRLKTLVSENTRLKKLVAERVLEIKVMKKISAKNGERTGSSGADPFCNETRVEPTASECATASPSVLHEL